MIIIRLAGGLGNQIFQLGAGLLLAQKLNTKKLILDDSALNSYDVKRNNELISFFDFSKLDLLVEFKHLSIIKLRLPKVLAIKYSKFPLVGDNNFNYIINNSSSSFLLLDGYFQWVLSQNNFNNIVDVLKTIFKNKQIVINNKTCVVHIRGGDFVKLGWNKITPTQYYLDAIKLMVEKYNIDKFIIVTDDKKYAKIIMEQIDSKYEFECSNMIDDFYTILLYSYRILSSSTFSFWASALGNNKEGIVIAPEFWFPNKKRDIYLKNEIRLENY
jgi:hypothetical protein